MLSLPVQSSWGRRQADARQPRGAWAGTDEHARLEEAKAYLRDVLPDGAARLAKSRRIRQVPLSPEAQDVLGSLDQEGGRVFELPETASWIRRQVIENSPVKDFCVHRLRHTFANQYLERGGSIEALKEILGHSTVKLAERYGKLRPHVVAAEAARMAEKSAIRSGITGRKVGSLVEAAS